MKFIIISLITLLVSNLAFSKVCTIETYDKILYVPTKNNISYSKVIKNSDCPDAVKRKFSNQIFNSSGTLSSRVLNSNEDISRLGYQVTLSPSKVTVTNLKAKLKRHFELGTKWSFGKLKLLNKRSIIGLNKEESLDLNCDFCHTTGEKNISLVVYNPIKNFSKTYWLSGTVFISTTVLVPRRAISPSEPQLIPSDFKFSNIDVTRPEKYFTNKDQLVFYKLNKPLAQGKGLEFTHLSPVNLVTAGVPTKVILKSKTLTLQAQGIPRQSGKLGEMIKLQNPKTKRVISGKVIDFNKVLVDL